MLWLAEVFLQHVCMHVPSPCCGLHTPFGSIMHQYRGSSRPERPWASPGIRRSSRIQGWEPKWSSVGSAASQKEQL